MLNFLDSDKRVFWTITPRNKMGITMDTISKEFNCGMKFIIINNEEYRTANGYRKLAESITVDYSKDNLVVVELDEIPLRVRVCEVCDQD